MDSKIINSSNALWKDLMLYKLNLILNSYQDLVLLKQKQIIGSVKIHYSIFKIAKPNNEAFLILLINALLHLTNNNSPLLLSHLDKINSRPSRIFKLTH